MNKEELHRLVSESTGNESNICQIYAMRDGRTVYEDCWHGYKTGDAVNVMSVTKGVMALLTGIAIDQGYVKSVDQKVLDFFPGYKVKRGEKTIYDVTVRHLLTMTAPYKYRSEPWTKVCTSEDWTAAALDLLGGRAGLTGEFKYATLGIQILSGIIENAAGVRCIDFANRNLFLPLGIPEHTIHGDSSKEDQFDFLMNKNPRKNEWYSDPKDTVTAGWGLCLSARDLARIGDLVLRGGAYDEGVPANHGGVCGGSGPANHSGICGGSGPVKHSGVCGEVRIISESYLKDMLTPHVRLGQMFGFMEYGYLWYKPYEDRQVYAAIGDGGNVIYVNKEKHISVGLTGTFKPRIFDRVEFIERNVLPLAEENVLPLAEERDKQSILK